MPSPLKQRKISIRNKDVTRWLLKITYTAAAAIVLFLLAYVFTPTVVNSFWGENIIERHVAEVVGNTNGADESAFKLLQWEEANFGEPYPAWEGKWYNAYGVYRINGSYKWFIRSTQLSWLITSKLGNCGERAYYFVQMMNQLGHPARVVCVVEDHCWAEYESDGFWIAVDPSQGTYVNPQNFAGGRNWSRIEARYLNGSVEDITHRYLNTTTLSIRAENNGGHVAVYSTALLSSGSARYNKPSLVRTQKLESPLALQLGHLPTYEVKYEKSYGPISFRTEYTNITLPNSIIILQNDFVRLHNLQPNMLSLLMLILLLVASAFIIMSRKHP